jgi:hypothetical protein
MPSTWVVPCVGAEQSQDVVSLPLVKADEVLVLLRGMPMLPANRISWPIGTGVVGCPIVGHVRADGHCRRVASFVLKTSTSSEDRF